MDGRTNERTDGGMDGKSPILQDFVPYRGRCPKRIGPRTDKKKAVVVSTYSKTPTYAHTKTEPNSRANTSTQTSTYEHNTHEKSDSARRVRNSNKRK